MILEFMYNIYMVLWIMSKHSNNNFWLRSRAPSAANPATLQAVPYFHLHEVHDIVHDIDMNMVSLSYIKFIFKNVPHHPASHVFKRKNAFCVNDPFTRRLVCFSRFRFRFVICEINNSELLGRFKSELIN